MSKKILISLLTLTILLVILYVNSLNAHVLDYEKQYKIVMPEWNLRQEDYESDIKSYVVNVSKINNGTFLITPTAKNQNWGPLENSIQKQSVPSPLLNTASKSWVGKIKNDNSVSISGVWQRGEAGIKVELSGDFVRDNIIRGSAAFKIVLGPGGELPLTWKSEWYLIPSASKESIKISKKISYHGPPANPVKVEAVSILAGISDNLPPIDDRALKNIARQIPSEREDYLRGLDTKTENYVENLLTELTWGEIQYTPGIILILDYLVTVDPSAREHINKSIAVVRDGSYEFFSGISFEELQKVPPYFLILKAKGRISKADWDGLIKASSMMYQFNLATQNVSNEELANTSFDGLIFKISGNLPIQIRQQYYQKSMKLKNYVEASEDVRLKDLYGFKE